MVVVAPAVALGLFVVFGIGYVLSQVILGGISERLEARERRRTGVIPSISHQMLDINFFSIMGGFAAVVLILFLLFAVPRESKALIWYVLTGIGIIAGLLTFVFFGSEPRPTQSQKPPSEPRVVQAPETPRGKASLKSQQPSKDELYRQLLSKTKNDRDLANRLIGYERKHKPEASEEELIKRAIERLEWDNR